MRNGWTNTVQSNSLQNYRTMKSKIRMIYFCLFGRITRRKTRKSSRREKIQAKEWMGKERKGKRKGDYMTKEQKTIIDACSMLIFKQISYIFRLKSKFGGIEKESAKISQNTDSLMPTQCQWCIRSLIYAYRTYLKYIYFISPVPGRNSIRAYWSSFQQSLKFNVI